MKPSPSATFEPLPSPLLSPRPRDPLTARLGFGSLVLILALFGGIGDVRIRADGPAAPVKYNRDIRPILAENCFACHGPDKGTRRADLRLDVRAAAVSQGAITPGPPDRSEIVARILSRDADELPQPEGGESAVRRLNRLDLARWITASENPLTARVFANRLWRQFFGTGIAAVMKDVGAQGKWPAHPALLDWLASDFRDRGWDVKRLVRTIVLSSTYRQSANLRA